MQESAIAIPPQSQELTIKELRYKLEFWKRGLKGVKQMMTSEGDEEIIDLIKSWTKEESDFMQNDLLGLNPDA